MEKIRRSPVDMVNLTLFTGFQLHSQVVIAGFLPSTVGREFRCFQGFCNRNPGFAGVFGAPQHALNW